MKWGDDSWSDSQEEMSSKGGLDSSVRPIADTCWSLHRAYKFTELQRYKKAIQLMRASHFAMGERVYKKYDLFSFYNRL